MSRAKYDLLTRFPFTLALTALSALGRLAQRRLRNDEATEPTTPPGAVPMGERIPFAAPLEGWITKQQAHTLAKNLQTCQSELRQTREKKLQLETKMVALEAQIRSAHVTSVVASWAIEYESIHQKNSALEEKCERLHAGNASLRTRLEAAEARLKQQDQEDQTEGASSHGGKRIREEKLTELFRLVFPKLRFWEGSAYRLVLSPHNLQQTYGKLRELNENSGAVRGQRVESGDGWIEVKFGKDGSTRDRLYFCHSSETGQTLVVLSEKKIQDADLRKLKRVAGEKTGRSSLPE